MEETKARPSNAAHSVFLVNMELKCILFWSKSSPKFTFSVVCSPSRHAIWFILCINLKPGLQTQCIFFSYRQLEIRINLILREFILMCFLYNNNKNLHIFKKFTSECRSCFKKKIQFKLPLLAILNNQKLFNFIFRPFDKTFMFYMPFMPSQIISHNRSQISLDTVWWWHKCGDTLSKIAFFIIV